jgi:hypothetical protein
MASKKWMAGAIKHPGALRDTAKRAGLITGGETLSAHDIAVLSRSKNPTTRKRAALAKTFKAAKH